MNIITTKNLPVFITKELEELHKKIAPIMMKTSKYMFWSFPMIMISLINLVFLLFFMPFTNEAIPSLLIYAIIGAIGFALAKEAKLKKKEIEAISSKYIIERIKKSDVVTAGRQQDYITRLKNQPKLALHYFIEFLDEENKREKRNLYS
ncbi:hypothetical protein DZB84_01035 [Bacillus sp. HNG]|uniref:DUF5392 family protein n=1 Tax=Bacillus sp. HNG TaxID=2293325 RepID=UPI000E2F3F9A|nr:DUF5392 family protein [Bacillus sp. HNG]RFB18872.1 hypothetical protein DZB84_01035 [Bacillus sp. HNG]